MRPQTLERIRIAPNEYGVSLMRSFERNNAFAASLAEVLLRECETGSRATYLGLSSPSGDLLVRLRLVTDTLRVLLIDELEAAVGHDSLLGDMLRYAGEEAERRGLPLAVLAAEDDVHDWGQLGFGDAGYRVLALG